MKKQIKSLNIVDQMLKYASELRMDDMAGEIAIPEEMAARTYSSEFDNRMSAYFKTMRRKSACRRTGKALTRVAVIVIAFLAVSTTVVMSVDAFRVPALEFFGRVEDGAYSASVVDVSGIYDSNKEEIKGTFLPSYVPEGYKLDFVDRAGRIYTVRYINDSDGFIIFQLLIEGSAVQVSNNGIQKEVPVKDQTGQLFLENGQSTLLFKYQKNTFLLGGTIDEEDIVHMADSLEYYK